MAIILSSLEQIFGTGPDPNQIGTNLTSITIRDGTFVNLTATNLNVTGPFVIGGVNITSQTLAAPAISLSEIEIVSPLAADMPLALIPKGAGGILVDIPDNTGVGGNARGDYSIDLQFARTLATQVASGTGAFMVATQNCTAAGGYSSIISGLSNTIDATSNYSSIIASQLSNITTSAQAVMLASASSTITNCPRAYVAGCSSTNITNGSAMVSVSTTNTNITGADSGFTAATDFAGFNTSTRCSIISSDTILNVLNSTNSIIIASTSVVLLNATGCLTAASNSSTASGNYCSSISSTLGPGAFGDYCSMIACTNCNSSGLNNVTIACNGSNATGTQNTFVAASNNCQINAPTVYSAVIASNASQANNDHCLTVCSNTSSSNAQYSLLACGTGSGVGNSIYFCAVGSNINGNFNDNCFIFSDGSAGLISPPNANSFTVRATGATAMAVYTDAGATTGVTIAAGASAWAVVSDRTVKENITPLDLSWASAAVTELPVYTYNFIGQPTEQRCIGPMAQDWAEVWQTNKSPRHIDTGDMAGITLGALKDVLRRLAALESAVAAAGIQV